MKKMLLAVALLPILVGCSASKSIDGKWNASNIPGMPAGSKMTMEFSGGSKTSIVANMEQPLPNGKTAKMVITFDGTYTLAGDMLTVKVNDAKMTVEGVSDAEKQMMISGMESQKSKIISDMNAKSGANKVKWIDDNTLELIGSDSTTKLTKV